MLSGVWTAETGTQSQHSQDHALNTLTLITETLRHQTTHKVEDLGDTEATEAVVTLG